MPWGWGKEFSIRRSRPLDGPASLDKSPHGSYLEAVKFRSPEEKQTGHHSTQQQTPLFLLSVCCFTWPGAPKSRQSWGQPIQKAASASLLQRWKRGSLQAVWTWGRGPGSQGPLGNLPSTSVSQVVICTDALKYQVPSNLGLSGVLQHKLT